MEAETRWSQCEWLDGSFTVTAQRTMLCHDGRMMVDMVCRA